MRLLLLAGACAGLAGLDLATDYGRPRTLKTTAQLELDLETTAFEMKIDDEPAEGRGPGGGPSSLVRSCVQVDRILEGAGSRPTHVQRAFERLRDESSFSFRDEERKDEREYPLQGVTLELTLDDDGKVQAEVSEGKAPDDEALLEGHELALGLDAFLPGEGDEVGATWELDDAALKRALGFALDQKLYSEPPRDESGRGDGERGSGERGRGGRGGAGRVLGYIAWSGKAKLAEADADKDGQRCARITLELEGSGELPEPRSRGDGRGFLTGAPAAALRAGTVQARLAGELFVAVEAKRPVALELDGTLRTESSYEREREGRVFSSHSVQEGRLTLTVQIEEPR